MFNAILFTSSHVLPPTHHSLAAQGRDISSFMLSGEPGNRLWAGESEWGELEWVSGWDKVLVKEEISITYNESQRRHLIPLSPKDQALLGNRQVSGRWANALLGARSQHLGEVGAEPGTAPWSSPHQGGTGKHHGG